MAVPQPATTEWPAIACLRGWFNSVDVASITWEQFSGGVGVVYKRHKILKSAHPPLDSKSRDCTPADALANRAL